MANFAPKRNATLISGTTYPTLLRFLPLLPESIRADAVRARWRHNQIFWDEYRLPNYLSNGTPLVSRFLVLVDLRLKCSLSSGIICGSLSQRCCRLSANRVVVGLGHRRVFELRNRKTKHDWLRRQIHKYSYLGGPLKGDCSAFAARLWIPVCLGIDPALEEAMTLDMN